MRKRFSESLNHLRKKAGMTNVQLAKQARVPSSLIAGLQTGKRCIGEMQARRIGVALGLHGLNLERFILDAINECTEKVLSESQYYPAHILNALSRQLKTSGIEASDVIDCVQEGDYLKLELADGRFATVEMKLAVA